MPKAGREWEPQGLPRHSSGEAPSHHTPREKGLWEAVRGLGEYGRCVSRGEHLARTYWFDLLMALLAIA